MKISAIQLDELLRKYQAQAGDSRFSDYGKSLAAETVAALRELKALRKNTSIPVRGRVS